MIAHFVLAGQSNIDQWFHAGDGAALEAFRETFLALNPQYTDVQFFDAARGGSAMLGASASDYAAVRAPDDAALHARISENYWYDEATGTAGPNLALFTERLASEVASGTEFLGIIWAQGEADTTYVGANGAEAYAEGLAFVLDALSTAAGTGQVHIQALGDRAFYSEDLHGGTDAIRQAQLALADTSDTITVETTIFDLDLRDSTHLTVEAYEEAARRMAVAISTGEGAPAAGEAVLVDATTLLVQIDLAPGQQVLTGIAPGGFTLTDGGVDVGIAAVSVTTAGLIRIEALSALSAPTVAYGAVEVSTGMQPDDYLMATGPNGPAAVLPFTLEIAPPRLATGETPEGLRISGSALSETLRGLSGDDELTGNAGHDTLIGGWGADLLTGGAGADRFVLGDDGATDRVLDFDLSADAIGLAGYSAAEATFFETAEGDLGIETGTGGRIVLEGVGLAAAGDVLFHMLGSDGANTLDGHAGADRIYGLGGDDRIDSGAGYDRIWVGAGADTVTFGSGYGTNIVYDFDLTEDGISLTDLPAAALTVRAYGSDDLELRTAAGDRLILRDIALSDAGLLKIEDAPRQVGFVQGTAGNDVLRGTALDELFQGLTGTDRLYGGGGSDVFLFAEGSGLNVIYDFGLGDDRILVEGGDFDALAILAYKDKDAEVRLDSGDRMVLRNVDADALGADDFLFSVPEDFL